MAPVSAFQRMKPQAGENGYSVAYEDVPLMEYDEAERRQAALPAEFQPDGKQSRGTGKSVPDRPKRDGESNFGIKALSECDLIKPKHQR